MQVLTQQAEVQSQMQDMSATAEALSAETEKLQADIACLNRQCTEAVSDNKLLEVNTEALSKALQAASQVHQLTNRTDTEVRVHVHLLSMAVAERKVTSFKYF